MRLLRLFQMTRLSLPMPNVAILVVLQNTIKKLFFDTFNVDAITLNPLMGFETLDAFSSDETKGVYVLALTSNPGAEDFLKKPFEGFDMMAEYIAHTLFERSIHTEAHLGMVVGATNRQIGN